ncbi:MAG: hypothetical protein JNL70_17930 [Saprospiraceae bacterium]|nr:hypothetical protein [Saprospiraceae bacterium]
MNLRLTPILTLFVAYLLFATSCKSDLGDKETIIAIDKEFEILPWERLDEYGGALQLRIATIKNQECGGTRINYSTNSLNNQLSVSLNSLSYPSICNGFAEPARDTIDLSNIKKGDFPFRLTLKDAIINDGVLHIEEGRYYFEMKKENGISMPKKELLRIPQGAIWGFISTDNGQDARYTQMIDSLRTVATPLSIPTGDYGYFNYSGSDIGIAAKFSTQKPNIRRFILRQTGTKEQLNNIVKYFKTVAGIDFLLFTSDGKSYPK